MRRTSPASGLSQISAACALRPCSTCRSTALKHVFSSPPRNPAVEGSLRPVEDLVPALRPMDVLRHLTPEALGIVERAAVLLLVAGHGETSSRPWNHLEQEYRRSLDDPEGF